MRTRSRGFRDVELLQECVRLRAIKNISSPHARVAGETRGEMIDSLIETLSPSSHDRLGRDIFNHPNRIKMRENSRNTVNLNGFSVDLRDLEREFLESFLLLQQSNNLLRRKTDSLRNKELLHRKGSL